MPSKNNLYVKLFTDGSCHPNPGPGGWGVLVIKPAIQGGFRLEKSKISGSAPRTTISRMELTAMLKGLRFITEPSNINIYSDSKYAVNTFKIWVPLWEARQWKTTLGIDVQNQDLIKAICRMVRFHKKVEFIWLPGHHGNSDNECADELARAARFNRINPEVDHGYESR